MDAVGRITRDVEPSAVAGLLVDPPRATVAFVDHDAAEVLAAKACSRGGSYLFAVDGAPELDGREVILVLDDGEYWFELRGVSVRGRAERVAPPADAVGERLRWYAVEPRRVLAWDYDAIREA